MAKPRTVEEYLAALPEEQVAALERLRGTIRAAAPDATEGIGYGMPAFKYHGRSLVAYGVFKDHFSFFPMSGQVLAAFEADLEPWGTSKGTIRFTADRPLPKALVRKIVKARLAEQEARGKR